MVTLILLNNKITYMEGRSARKLPFEMNQLNPRQKVQQTVKQIYHTFTEIGREMF
jgi:hypothetical protein